MFRKKVKHLIKGIVKSVPGIEYIYGFNKTTGGSNSARYCYGVWLRHLVFAYENGYKEIPKVVAELGPGDTLGAGIAALISGADKYYPLDVKMYGDAKANLEVFEELVLLFKQRSRIPDEKEFPEIHPKLKSYEFPVHIFNERHLEGMLRVDRLAAIRTSIERLSDNKVRDSLIEYKVPWDKDSSIGDGTFDMIFSQAVLNSVDDLDYTYKKMGQLLKVTGIQSHDIGFKSCGSADTWYGHWEYSDLEWSIVRGRKSFYINRQPSSRHMELLKENSFDIVYEQRRIVDSNIDRRHLSRRFADMSEQDLTTYCIFIQARKKSF